MINRIIKYPFYYLMSLFEGIGRYAALMFQLFRSFKNWNYYLGFTIDYMVQIGAKSIPIVILTSLFAGMVTAVQAAYQFETGLVPDWFVGSIVSEAVLLELGPMLTALVMTGSIGATITAEIGTMRVTEQIDALESLSFDPISYLILPRVLAAAIMFPILIMIADIFGILGGLYSAMMAMDISVDEFIRGFKTWFVPKDAWLGLVKGLFFGLAITSISCYQGFYTEGSAQGVGKATTSSVVNSCMAIVILNYIIAALFL